MTLGWNLIDYLSFSVYETLIISLTVEMFLILINAINIAFDVSSGLNVSFFLTPGLHLNSLSKVIGSLTIHELKGI